MPKDNIGEPGCPPLALVTADNEVEIRALAEIARDLIEGAGKPLADLDAAAKRARPLAPVIPINKIELVLRKAMRDRGVDIHENAVARALSAGPASQLEDDIDHLHIEIAAHRARDEQIKAEITLCALRLSWMQNRGDRLPLARQLYWQPDSIAPAWAVAAGLLLDRLDLAYAAQASIKREAIGLISQAKQLIGPCMAVRCLTRGCGGLHYVRSRRSLQGYRGLLLQEFGEFCPQCAANSKARWALASPR